MTPHPTVASGGRQSEYIFPVAASLLDHRWHTLAVDLRQDSLAGFNSRFASLNWFCFRGDVDIAQIRVSDDVEFLRRRVEDPVNRNRIRFK